MFGRKKEYSGLYQVNNTEESTSPVITSNMVETVDLGNVAEYHMRFLIHNRNRLEIEVYVIGKVKETKLSFSLEEWQAMERRILEGIQAVTQ